MAVWTDSNEDCEAIWDLQYHGYQELLLSLNASNSIVLWDCSDIPQGERESISDGKVRHRFQYSSGGDVEDSATSLAWLETQ